MSTGESKTCTKCGAEKPLEEFHRNRSNKTDGRTALCKLCNRARRNAWYRDNRETNLAYQAKWRSENVERKSVGDAAWRAANVERKRANDAAWRDANREHLAEYFRSIAARRNEDPAYLEARAAAKARRRARLADVEHQPYTRRGIYDRDGGECCACRTALPFEKGGFQIDHIVPIFLGGPDTPANLQLMCPTCNQKKAAKLEGQLHMPT